MSFLTDAGVPLLAAKAITEGVLFVLSYGVQRTLVFPPPAAAVGGGQRHLIACAEAPLSRHRGRTSKHPVA